MLPVWANPDSRQGKVRVGPCMKALRHKRLSGLPGKPGYFGVNRWEKNSSNRRLQHDAGAFSPTQPKSLTITLFLP
jgi:hypothetical protein